MECSAVQKILDASADGELDPSTQHRVDSHLEACPNCAAQLGFTLTVKQATKEALTAKAPAALRMRVVAELEASKVRRRPRWVALAVSVSAIAAILLGALVLRAPNELAGAELARLHHANAPDVPPVVDRRPEAAELVDETQLVLDGNSVRHRHYRLGSASFSVLSSQQPIPVQLTDRGDVAGASVQHETQDGTTVAAALNAPRFVVMSRDPALAIEFAALNLLQRLAE